MPLLKVQEPGESNAAIAAVLRGNRLANSIRAITLQMEKRIRVYEDGRTRLMEVHPFISCSHVREMWKSAPLLRGVLDVETVGAQLSTP